jgi:hypothetical protein
MPKPQSDAALPERESPMDRMMRFGTALFAVKKDELPKRDERDKPKPGPNKAKPVT